MIAGALASVVCREIAVGRFVGEGLIAGAQRPRDIALGVALGHRVALVVEFLTLGQAEFDLGATPLQVEAEGDQG